MKQMEHLKTEELVELYYGEAPPDRRRDAERHVDDCSGCAAALASLKCDLEAVGRMEAPGRDEEYGERMWRRVAKELERKGLRDLGTRDLGTRDLGTRDLGTRDVGTGDMGRRRWPRRFRAPWGIPVWRGLAYAAGCAVLLTGAFYVGTVWEHQQHLRRAAARAASGAHAPTPPKVVVVVLGDHLDRSERLLVELKHADAENEELVKPLRQEAQGLLAANRVFREDAEKSGDAELMQALDKLDKLLTEVVDEPGGLNAAALERLQKEMTGEGLLFEVRVLRSKNPYRKTAVRVTANGGAA